MFIELDTLLYKLEEFFTKFGEVNKLKAISALNN